MLCPRLTRVSCMSCHKDVIISHLPTMAELPVCIKIYIKKLAH